MRRDARDPEIVWRELVRRQCEKWNMVIGSWKYATAQQLACDPPGFGGEAERYGPPLPDRWMSEALGCHLIFR